MKLDIDSSLSLGQGSLQLSSQGAVRVAGALLAGKAASIQADADGDGEGTFTLEKAGSVATNEDEITGNIDISAGSLEMHGRISAGGAMSISSGVEGGTILVGRSMNHSVGVPSLTPEALSQLTAHRGLTLGGRRTSLVEAMYAPPYDPHTSSNL